MKVVESKIQEDTVKKSNGKWTNRGKDGKEHGEFDTKKDADAQRKAMYANGYEGESLSRVEASDRIKYSPYSDFLLAIENIYYHMLRYEEGDTEKMNSDEAKEYIRGLVDRLCNSLKSTVEKGLSEKDSATESLEKKDNEDKDDCMTQNEIQAECNPVDQADEILNKIKDEIGFDVDKSVEESWRTQK